MSYVVLRGYKVIYLIENLKKNCCFNLNFLSYVVLRGNNVISILSFVYIKKEVKWWVNDEIMLKSLDIFIYVSEFRVEWGWVF